MSGYGFNFDNTYINLPKIFYTELSPSPVRNPEMVLFNSSVAKDLGLNLSAIKPEDKAALFSGNVLPKDTRPFAQAYAGHQFGNFTILGDGRAVMMGEHISPSDHRFDIQFKGSGPTPYSRGADGRAALGPMLREYIISEAMHALNIPTTRSLAVVSNGENVYREKALPGAVLTRVSSSHIRVGTFEYAAFHNDKSITGALVDYTIKRHYSKIEGKQNNPLLLLKAVIEKQVDLIIHWMRVGFIHGVMNTDNMVLSGETIDYGPCAFMDSYNTRTVFSSIDHRGRYCYGNQPAIAQWNLARLGETIFPLLNDEYKNAKDLIEEAVNDFGIQYEEKWFSMMRSKLGLIEKQEGDQKLITDLLQWMQSEEIDYTNTFLYLMGDKTPDEKPYTDIIFKEWHDRWKIQIAKSDNSFKSSLVLMRASNPSVIPRNHIIEKVLNDATDGDMKPFNNFLKVLQAPYSNHSELKNYQSPPNKDERVCETFCGT